MSLAVAVAAALALVATACGDDAAPEAEGEVSVFGIWRGDDARNFADAVEPFEDATGIDVRYVGSAGLATALVNRLDQGTRPDIAFVAQPGLMRSLAQDGDLLPLPSEVVDQIEANYAPVWLDLGAVDDEVYALWWEVDVKSLVWYPVDTWEKQGYEVPATIDDLIQLTDQIADDGYSGWCPGMGAYTSTGWLATDWVEDILLRREGGDFYDQWVAHDVAFDSDEVTAAVRIFGRLATQADRILGQPDSWLSVPVADAPLPMLEDPPSCMLYRQANFAQGYFPPGTDIAPDGDVWFFPFPPAEQGGEKAVIVGGQMALLLNDTPEAKALLEYLARPESSARWTEQGGLVPAHESAQSLDYGSELDQALAELVASADVVKFDGSDLMVPEVGTGTFWTGMVDFVAGKSAADVTAQIEDSWPQS